MSFRERRVKAERLAAERGWTVNMPLEQRRRLSNDDWNVFRDAFAKHDWSHFSASEQDHFQAILGQSEAIERLSSTEHDPLAPGV